MSAFESKKYSWKSGWSPSVKPDVVGKIFEEIEERDGEVTSQSLLDASRSEDSPTHGLFEWNDSVAAEKFRLSQSHRIISQLQVDVIVTEIPSDKPSEVEITTENVLKSPAYVNVNPVGRFGVKNTKGSFVSVQKAMSDDDMRKIVLRNALSELNVFKNRYALYKELAGVFEAIKEFERSIE